MKKMESIYILVDAYGLGDISIQIIIKHIFIYIFAENG